MSTVSSFSLKVTFTALQIDELAHKLSIVVEEPDLQDSYDVSQEEAEALAQLFACAKPGDVTFDERYRDMLAEELEDAMASRLSNWIDCGNDADGGVYRSLAQAVGRIRGARRVEMWPLK